MISLQLAGKNAPPKIFDGDPVRSSAAQKPSRARECFLPAFLIAAQHKPENVDFVLGQESEQRTAAANFDVVRVGSYGENRIYTPKRRLEHLMTL